MTYDPIQRPEPGTFTTLTLHGGELRSGATVTVTTIGEDGAEEPSVASLIWPPPTFKRHDDNQEAQP